MVRVKEALPLAADAPGGFLLGTSAGQYAAFAEKDIVYVLEDDQGEVTGFSIVLRDATVRASDLWRKKDSIPMEGMSAEVFDAFRIAYFEQLAVLPGAGYRTYAKDLALHALADAFKLHDLMFATVVIEPVQNLASLSFLKGAGFQRVGEIDEEYEGQGAIRSAVYLLTRQELQARLVGGIRDIAKKVLGNELEGLL